MSQHFKDAQSNAITQSGISRVIPCKELDIGDPIKWLSLGLRDFLRTPVISLFYGIMFAVIPWLIVFLVRMTGWHLVILPAIVCFMLIGPFLAAGLYDVSWELEKGHKPTLRHSLRAMKRNAVNEWGFGILLMVLMIFWLRVASLIHALYPPYLDDSLDSLLPFLALGTLVGAAFVSFMLFISAFTQPILMERKVDLATAVLTSVNAVWLNKVPMFIWGGLIFSAVAIGFVTGFIGFVFLMPLIGYATWHGYIDTITTKRERNYV
ncbi:DUF2189 domain-containing protein [Alteromonas aestuariivivens]|uniref:DUF2189 domain-containing protein n=1 Tax=Alteromonas aestuariivivens TaxID=1938339 RepID=A0A3D8MBD8_9ALTE|nr:DUF2189 domain-containing protein [Alteromonas aestuariivivens]RDV27405.1 DUF2189 domain-containing protein [Alteromonas aestuariivivens]